ncbi:MAG: hypothetical protein M5U31_07810 [Acidimicrobiia bacterium]|nr:hypothetical protein [Acidimicrobiia bacterium]
MGLALKDDDRAVLGAISAANGGEYFVAQFTTAGVLDNTFGTGGIVLIPNAAINADEDGSPALVVDFLSRTLLAGIAEGGGGRYFVSRFTTAGVLDTTFGTGGIVFIPNATINADENSGVGLAVRPDGSPVLGGINQTSDLYFLAQFTNTGALDTGFSGDGIAYLTGINADQDPGVSVTLQPDGKVLLGAIDETEREYTLSRFTTDGSLDPDFATGGIAVVPSTSILADETSGVAVVLQSDGKPVLGGIDQTTTNAEEFFVARFDGDIASLELLKAGPATARPGDTVLYTITLTNTSSTESAFGVSLTEVLPTGMAINDIVASGDGSWTCVVALATCDTPFLSPGDVATFTVQATVDPGAPAGVVTNTASAGATNAFGTSTTSNAETEILGDTPPEPPGPPEPPEPPGPPAPPEQSAPPAPPGPDAPTNGAGSGLDELPRTGPTGPLQLMGLALAALLSGATLTIVSRGSRFVRLRSA